MVLLQFLHHSCNILFSLSFVTLIFFISLSYSLTSFSLPSFSPFILFYFHCHFFTLIFISFFLSFLALIFFLFFHFLSCFFTFILFIFLSSFFTLIFLIFLCFLSLISFSSFSLPSFFIFTFFHFCWPSFLPSFSLSSFLSLIYSFSSIFFFFFLYLHLICSYLSSLDISPFTILWFEIFRIHSFSLSSPFSLIRCLVPYLGCFLLLATLCKFFPLFSSLWPFLRFLISSFLSRNFLNSFSV